MTAEWNVVWTACPVCGKEIGLSDRTNKEYHFCSYCNSTCHVNHSRSVLDPGSFAEGKVVYKYACDGCAARIAESLGANRYCSDCRKDMFSNESAKLCHACGRITCCTAEQLSAEAFGQDRIEYVQLCPACKEHNRKRFRAASRCRKCGGDAADFRASRCDRCGAIGHAPCMHEMAGTVEDDMDLLKPYILEQPANWLCSGCQQKLLKEIQRIDAADWPVVTPDGDVRGHRIVRELQPIETPAFESEQEALEEAQIYVLQLRGNALLHYRCLVHQQRVLAGYSESGEPYFDTEDSYSAEGVAAVIEEALDTMLVFKD